MTPSISKSEAGVLSLVGVPAGESTTYQWYKDGAAVEGDSGKAATYTAGTTAGKYFCEVTVDSTKYTSATITIA